MRKHITLPLKIKTPIKTLHKRLETIPKEYVPDVPNRNYPYPEYNLYNLTIRKKRLIMKIYEILYR